MLAEVTGWLSPEGVMAMVTLLALLLSIAKNLAQAAGKKDLAEKLGEAERHGTEMRTVLGTVIRGVDEAGRRLDAESKDVLVETLRDGAVAAGTEDAMRPIVAEVRAAAPGAQVEVAVKKGTDRFRRPGTDPLPLLALLLAVMLAGCSCNASVRENAPVLERAWDTYRRASQPAEGVDPEQHLALEAAVTRNMAEVHRAASE